MSEYTAVMAASLGVMYFWTWLAFKLDDKHDGFRLFLIMASFVMSWAVMFLGTQVLSTTTPPSGLTNADNYAYRLTILIGTLSLLYFAIRYVFGLASTASKQEKYRGVLQEGGR